MSTWGGLRGALWPSTSSPSRPPPVLLEEPGPPGLADPGRGGIGAPPAPDREGQILAPPAAALRTAPSIRPPCLRSLRAEPLRVSVLGLSPGGRDLPRSTGSAPGPHRPLGRMAAWLGAPRRRQTAGSCDRCTGRQPRCTRPAPDEHAVPVLLFSLAAGRGEPPAAEAVRARDGAWRRLARSVRRRRWHQDRRQCEAQGHRGAERRGPRSATLASLSAGGRGRTGPA